MTNEEAITAAQDQADRFRARVAELEEICEMRKSASVLYKATAESFRAERDAAREVLETVEDITQAMHPDFAERLDSIYRLIQTHKQA